MADLHIELIDRLREAASSLRSAMGVIGDEYGSDDELFDKLSEAASVADSAADRLESAADTYGEMIHHGI
jgi:hypothetical protein